jgi:general secretion pathway protein K
MKLTTYKKQSGVVLPAVLWIVMACLVVTASYSSNIKLSIGSLSNSKDSMVLAYAARAGVYVALSELLEQAKDYSFSVKDKDFTKVINGKFINVTMQSQNSMLAINQATDSQIQFLLKQNGVVSGLASTISQRILDWRDTDSLRRVNGMEDNDYYAAGYKYGAKDKPFEDIEELKLVKGVDESIFRILSENVTLYPASVGKVVTFDSSALDRNTNKKARIIAVIQLSGNNNQPYRILKWSTANWVI